MKLLRVLATGAGFLIICAGVTRGQEAPLAKPADAQNQVQTDRAPVSLTLKRAIELALQNSKEIQAAKIQTRLGEHSAAISKAAFLPAIYAGSGAGYSFGIPETPGGRAPSIFNVTYDEQVLNEPLRGQTKELQEKAKAQNIALEDVKNSVITGTAMAYLELAKVRHSLELLRKEQESADKILLVTQERQGEGYELPVEVTKARLTKAQVQHRILQLEGRQDELEVFLRSELGLSDSQAVEVAPEDLPGAAEQAGDNLMAMALASNASLRLAGAEVRASEFRLKGEKRGYLPTLELVSTYSVLAKFNNYAEFFNHFQRNNFNAGINVQVPIFSARTKSAIAVAQLNLDVAKVNFENKRTAVTAEVRQRTRKVRERASATEVARLELQLAQQDLSVQQALFTEGKLNLRELERSRLTENEKWMAYLDANFQKQGAQLDLLKSAGQLDKVWQ
jgi:outer membrane protein